MAATPPTPTFRKYKAKAKSRELEILAAIANILQGGNEKRKKNIKRERMNESEYG